MNGSYSQATTGIVPISLTIPGLDEFVDLECSYLEVEIKLNSAVTNGIVADANSALDANNTKFVYVTGQIYIQVIFFNLGQLLTT